MYTHRLFGWIVLVILTGYQWMYIGYYNTGISKSRLNLTDISMIANFTSDIRVRAVCMDIDLNEQRLYWMNDDGDIKSVNVDGSDVKTVISTNSSSTEYFAIGVSDSYIYYADRNQLVMRNKSQGSIPTVLYTDTDSINSIYVFISKGTPTMKTDIQLCVCIALVAVCIAGVRSASSYGGGSKWRRCLWTYYIIRWWIQQRIRRRWIQQRIRGKWIQRLWKRRWLSSYESRGRFLMLPLLLPGTLLRGWKTKRRRKLRVTPAINARTGGRRRGGGGGGLFGGGGGGFGGIFSLIIMLFFLQFILGLIG